MSCTAGVFFFFHEYNFDLFVVFFSVLDWRCYCSGWVNCLVSKLSGRVSYELRNRPRSPWSLWLSGRASERGIRRSEIRFLLGTQNFFLCPTLVTRRWKKHLSLNYLVFLDISLWQIHSTRLQIDNKLIEIYHYNKETLWRRQPKSLTHHARDVLLIKV